MSDIVERRLFQHADTDKAMLLSPTNLYHDAEKLGAWFAKSQIEITNTDVRHGGKKLVTVLIPDWLLAKRTPMPDAEPGYEFGHNLGAAQ
jgi:hypothetical protein